jgi:ABC-type multidrug transport system fused ATPase/permease subunit
MKPLLSNNKPLDLKNEPLKPIRFWERLWFYLKPYRTQTVTAISCTAIAGLFMAMQPLAIKFIIDSGINRPDAPVSVRFKWTFFFIGCYLFVSAARMVSFYFGLKAMSVATEGAVFNIRSRFFRHVQRLCFKFHDKMSSGELFNYVMGSPVTLFGQFIRTLGLSLPTAIVSWLVALSALAVFDWEMTLIMIAGLMIIALVNNRSRERVRTMSEEYMAIESSVSRTVADLFRGTRTVKIHSVEDETNTLFETRIGQIRDNGAALQYRQWIENAKPEFLNYFVLAAIYGFGAWSCLYRGMSVGTFLAFTISLNQLLGPLMMLFQLNLQRGNAEAGLQRIEHVLSLTESTPEPEASAKVSVEEAHTRALLTSEPEILVEKVGFSYENNRVLENVSCAIQRTTTCALVGPSGSGKSTFVKLLLRLYDQSEGRILINGADIHLYSLHELRSYFGVVPQDPFMFQMSIKENIRIASPAATDEEIKDAMDSALVSEFVDKLPQRWNTMVGENGYSVSGGQRQRIAIARAILTKPSCFIFDEATSALDTTSEMHIRKAIESLSQKHTVIIIAHRLSTVKYADKILVFNNGNIVQQGTYASLSSEDGVFKELVLSAA